MAVAILGSDHTHFRHNHTQYTDTQAIALTLDHAEKDLATYAHGVLTAAK